MAKKIKIKKKLEDQMVSYRDLIDVPVYDNEEAFIYLNNDEIPNGYSRRMSDMASITGSSILVREQVAKLLLRAQVNLKKQFPTYTLFVTYGYRSLEVQTENFLQQLAETHTFFPDAMDLYEEVHRFIAVPTVAGHPTGGAIDIIIKDEKTNRSLDFGSEQYEYQTKDCYVFIDTISKHQRENRMLLRNVLRQAGFAPFDGEWWHFSYGDREWAYYYKKSATLYDEIEVKNLVIKN